MTTCIAVSTYWPSLLDFFADTEGTGEGVLSVLLPYNMHDIDLYKSLHMFPYYMYTKYIATFLYNAIDQPCFAEAWT